MKLKYLLLPFALTAQPMAAEDMLFVGPGDSLVRMAVSQCPDGMTCLPAQNATVDARLNTVAAMATLNTGNNINLMVPNWTQTIDLSTLGADPAAATYLQGMSDGYIVDFCNLCDCCAISYEVDPMNGFQPWDTALYSAAQSGSLRLAPVE